MAWRRRPACGGPPGSGPGRPGAAGGAGRAGWGKDSPASGGGAGARAGCGQGGAGRGGSVQGRSAAARAAAGAACCWASRSSATASASAASFVMSTIGRIDRLRRGQQPAACRSRFPGGAGAGCGRKVSGRSRRRRPGAACCGRAPAAATCRVSEVAQAASAAAAGSVQARLRICAVASAATRVAWSQSAFRSSAVRSGCLPGATRCGVHRRRSLGQVKSGEFPAAVPSLVVSPGKATAYPVALVVEPPTSCGLAPRPGRCGEELVLVAGGAAPQRDPGGFAPGYGGRLSRSPRGGRPGPRCGRRARTQPVPLLGGDACGAEFAPFPRTSWAYRHPAGPASPPGGYGPRRAAPRPTGRPRPPGRRVTARYGASPRARWPPTRRRSASGLRGRRIEQCHTGRA